MRHVLEELWNHSAEKAIKILTQTARRKQPQLDSTGSVRTAQMESTMALPTQPVTNPESHEMSRMPARILICSVAILLIALQQNGHCQESRFELSLIHI